jgi:hypothetical protein
MAVLVVYFYIDSDYDSPSKDHEDFHHLLVEPSGKSTKR